MSIIANTLITYTAKGLREDLTDMIYSISPEEVPFLSNIGRGTAKATFHEWQTDSLAAVDTANAQLEGDDIASFPATAATSRIGNYTQISRKLLVVSETERAVDKAGRDDELGYQLAKRSVELKRDQESMLLDNIVAAAGSSTVARTSGSMGAFVKTNTDKGGSGVDPVYTTIPNNARTDGTQRAFTETILKNVLQKVFTSGGDAKIIMLGAAQKQTASTFAGVATKTIQQTATKAASIIGAADIYVSDFSTLAIIPNRFQRARDGWVLDPEYLKLLFLTNRKPKVKELATTGDAEKRMLICEWTLQVGNEASQGLCADLS